MTDIEELSCAQLVELVTAYVEGALDDRERARFDEHLAICEGCANYLTQMRLTIKLTGGLRVDDLTPRRRDELLAAFAGWRADSPG